MRPCIYRDSHRRAHRAPLLAKKITRIVGATLVVALTHSGSHKGGDKPRLYHEKFEPLRVRTSALPRVST